MTILPPQLLYFFNFPNVVSKPIEGDDAVVHSVVAWHKNRTNPDAQKFLQLEAILSREHANEKRPQKE